MNWNYIREYLYILPLAPIVIAVLLSIAYWIFWMLPKYIRNRREIRNGARKARQAEHERKRLICEAKMGRAIFNALREEYEMSGSRPDTKVLFQFPLKNRHCKISVHQLANGEPVLLMDITVDWRMPWNRRVEVRVGKHIQWPDTYSASRHIRYLAKEFHVFK